MKDLVHGAKVVGYYNYKVGRLFLAIHWLHSGFRRQNVINHFPYFIFVV
jgi:hypothetical protein